jgi:hypothetical protein
MISSDDIAQLCPRLRHFLDQEVQSGNEIVETWRGWPKEAICVALKQPFVVRNWQSPGEVEYRLVDDPRYWKEELRSTQTGHLLVCRFG